MNKIIEDSSEKIEEDTEEMDSGSEQIEPDTEKIPEIMSEKTGYRGQRGPDKSRRRINPNSLKNLKQNQKPLVEEQKPFWKRPEVWIGGSLGLFAFILLCLKVHDVLEKSREERSEES